MTFAELNLSAPLLKALAHEGYSTPTPIQAQAIPHVLSGKDVFGCAQTGTGKTAAFSLPLLHRLTQGHEAAHAPVTPVHAPTHGALHAPAHHGRNARSAGSNHDPRSNTRRPIRALVLSPTRELALQILESLRTYGKQLHLRSSVIFGGVSQHGQERELRAGMDILVATPGRLLDLMQQGLVDLRHVECFVLDEADRMLDMGFIVDIRKVVAKLPTHRQTLMFSATMPPEIRTLANTILRDPIAVQVVPVASTASLVEQSLYYVEKGNKPFLLTHILKNSAVSRALVFTRTKHGADRLVHKLESAGIRAESIHGNKSNNARQRALANFKSQRPPVLVATDVAARGIDVDDISHVFNYDLSNEPETHVHRIGRTGRAGATGRAISFCDREERGFLRAIERLIRKPIPVVDEHPEYPKHEHRPAEPRHESRGGAHHESRGGTSSGHSRPLHAPKPHARPQHASHTPHAPRPHNTHASVPHPSRSHSTGASHAPQHRRGPAQRPVGRGARPGASRGHR